MKKMVEYAFLFPSLVLIGVTLVGCAPGTAPAEPTLQVATPSDTAVSSITAASPAQTETPTFTASPAAIDTLTSTPEPDVSATASASPTGTLCPFGTAEPLWVEPVSSPTDKLSQTIVVRIGYGEEVTIVTESGTFTVTGDFDAYTNPALVEITLLPNTVHNLQVSARVKTITTGGCPYGGYTLTTTTDRQGAPLTIVQQPSVP